MKTFTDAEADELREAVRRKYAEIAAGSAGDCCSADSGCSDGSSTDSTMIGDAYDEIEGYAADADLGLGCGIPTDHAGLAAGQTVVDLGSGAGLDAFVARRVVGEDGRVIGVDFTPEMVRKARANADNLGFSNVTFVEGEIEDLPLYESTADVILSNCVLNLVPDKEQAFREIYRTLRPGGHFCISDIVSGTSLAHDIRRSAELYAGCVAGALEEQAYIELIRAAGFQEVEIPRRRRIEVPDEALPDTLSAADRDAFSEGGLWSITVRGVKPGER
jgi:SAM-dependent methyltransferase